MGPQHETEFLEDSLALSGYLPFSSRFGSSEEEFFDSDDVMTSRPPRSRSAQAPNLHPYDATLPMTPAVSTRQELKRRYAPHGWPHRLVLSELKSLLPFFYI